MLNTQQTQQILEALPYPALMISKSDHICASNTHLFDVFNTVVVNQNYVSILRQPKVLAAIETCRKTGNATQSTYIGQAVTGDKLYQLTAKGVDADNIMVSFQDKTQLETAHQQRKDFVANVSHELRTPLTAIIGLMDTLKGPALSDHNASIRFLDMMSAETQRMNSLINDLLSLSAVEATQHVRPSKQVNIAHLIAEVVSRQERIHATQIETELPSEPLNVVGDTAQLEQVLMNLLENAIKYGSNGEDPPIKLQVEKIDRDPSLRKPAIRIDVTDHGSGIDPLDIPLLTQRFYRVDAHRSRGVGGTGLGLAIVKHILNRHRGRLQIKSKVGQGSTFSVFLPI